MIFIIIIIYLLSLLLLLLLLLFFAMNIKSMQWIYIFLSYLHDIIFV